MIPPGALYLGIDAGGTRTRAVVAGADLVVRGRGASGPANASTRPVPRVVETLLEAAEDALASAGASAESLARVACGVAGLDSSGSAARLRSELEDAFGPGRVLLTSDARAALAGASAESIEGPGVVLIAGTGAIAFGRSADGREARAGGWGHLVGDEGSGYWMSRQALAAALRDFDGRGPRTAMRDLLFGRDAELHSPSELLQKLNRSEGGAADLAAYFPLVLRAAQGGDAIAARILHDAGKELALAAATVIRKLGLDRETFPVATVGGVFAAGDALLHPLRADLLAAAPGARLAPALYAPELGAIRLALAEERVERLAP